MKRSIDITASGGSVPPRIHTPDTGNFVKGAVLFFMDVSGGSAPQWTEMVKACQRRLLRATAPTYLSVRGVWPFRAPLSGDPQSREKLVKMINKMDNGDDGGG